MGRACDSVSLVFVTASDFDVILRALQDAHVRYLVVGGVALEAIAKELGHG